MKVFKKGQQVVRRSGPIGTPIYQANKPKEIDKVDEILLDQHKRLLSTKMGLPLEEITEHDVMVNLLVSSLARDSNREDFLDKTTKLKKMIEEIEEIFIFNMDKIAEGA